MVNHHEPKMKGNSRRKRKSPSQLTRDKNRAEAYRSKKMMDSIVLPFSGHLLPIQKADPKNAAADFPVEVDVTPPNSNPPTYQDIPMKDSAGVEQSFYFDVNSTKKELFPTQSASTTPASAKCPGPAYRKKEEETWTKLFN